VLAATEVNGLGFGGIKLDRRKTASLVAAVAEGLAGTATAGTPEIALAGFNCDGIRRLLGDYRF
jgi:hypothetical protein